MNLKVLYYAKKISKYLGQNGRFSKLRGGTPIFPLFTEKRIGQPIAEFAFFALFRVGLTNYSGILAQIREGNCPESKTLQYIT